MNESRITTSFWIFLIALCLKGVTGSAQTYEFSADGYLIEDLPSYIKPTKFKGACLTFRINYSDQEFKNDFDVLFKTLEQNLKALPDSICGYEFSSFRDSVNQELTNLKKADFQMTDTNSYLPTMRMLTEQLFRLVLTYKTDKKVKTDTVSFKYSNEKLTFYFEVPKGVYDLDYQLIKNNPEKMLYILWVNDIQPRTKKVLGILNSGAETVPPFLRGTLISTVKNTIWYPGTIVSIETVKNELETAKKKEAELSYSVKLNEEELEDLHQARGKIDFTITQQDSLVKFLALRDSLRTKIIASETLIKDLKKQHLKVKRNLLKRENELNRRIESSTGLYNGFLAVSTNEVTRYMYHLNGRREFRNMNNRKTPKTLTKPDQIIVLAENLTDSVSFTLKVSGVPAASVTGEIINELALVVPDLSDYKKGGMVASEKCLEAESVAFLSPLASVKEIEWSDEISFNYFSQYTSSDTLGTDKKVNFKVYNKKNNLVNADSFEINKIVYWIPAGGLIFSNSDHPRIEFEDGIIKRTGNHGGLFPTIGVKIYPGGTHLRDYGFIFNKRRVPNWDLGRKLSIYAGANIAHILRDFQVGVGVDLVAGLTITGGVHIMRVNQPMLEQGALKENRSFADYSWYYGITTDARPFYSLFKALF